MSAASLYDAANTLLAESILALDWTDRNYVSNGEPAYECCPQLTVHANIIELAPTFVSEGTSQIQDYKRNKFGVILVTMTVTVLRCVPTFKQDSKSKIIWPDPLELDAASALMMSDAWKLWNWLRARIRANLFLPDFPCREIRMGPAVPIPDQGGCGGWTLTVSFDLEGYDPPGVES